MISAGVHRRVSLVSIDIALLCSAGSRDLEIAPTDGGGESWRGGRSYERLVRGAHPTTAKS